MSGSQTNKCLNEKRRREQEKVYIEELAELISEWLDDMNSLSVKPDKCAILQETLKQMRIIKKELEPSNDDLQAAEVSSSKPNIIASDVLGPLLLEVLDGFLLVINFKGIIEYVSENVSLYLKYKQNKLVSKSIYDVVHKEDHLEFKKILLNKFFNKDWSSNNLHSFDSQSANFSQNNVNILSGSNCSSVNAQTNNLSNKLETGSKSKVFNARFKIKPTKIMNNNLNHFLINQNRNKCELREEDNEDDSEDENENKGDENQTKDSDILLNFNNKNQSISSSNLSLNSDQTKINYLNLQISAVLSTLPETSEQKFSGNNASNSNINRQKNALVCVARRLPVNKSESTLTVDQFSTKLDLNGTIKDLDTTGIPFNLETSIQSIKNKNLQNLVSPKYYQDVITYLRKVSQTNASVISENFELVLSDKLLIVVRMKSKKLDDYIIATYSIIKQISQDNIKNSTNINTSEKNQFKSIQLNQVQLSQQNQFQKNQISLKQNTENSVVLSTSSQTPIVSIFSPKLSTSSPFLQYSTSSSSSISQKNICSLISSTPSLVSSFNASKFSSPIATVSGNLQNNFYQNNQSVNSQKILTKNSNNVDFNTSSSLNSFNTNNSTQNSDSNTSNMELFNNYLNISDLFPTSNWIDYENNLNEKTLNHSTESLLNSSKQNLDQVTQNQNELPQQQQTDKLRSLLTQISQDESSTDNILTQNNSLNSSFSINTSDSSVQQAKTIDNQKQIKILNNSQEILQTSLHHQINTTTQSKTVFRSILNQDEDDDFCLSSNRLSSSMSNSNTLNFNNSTNINLENIFEKCNTFSKSSPVCSPILSIINSNIGELKNENVTNSSTNNSATLNNTNSNNTSDIKLNKGNNMLRKLLNDDDSNKSFRKGKDVLIQQLLLEINCLSPTASLENSINDQNLSINSYSKNVSTGNTSSSTSKNITRINSNDSIKYSSMKRKSNEDHFANNNSLINQNNNSKFLNSSNNSCFSNSLSNSQPGTPLEIDNGLESYQSAKRLSLSEPLSRPSSTPATTSNIIRHQSHHLQYSNKNLQLNSNSPLSLSNQPFANQKSSNLHHSQSFQILNGTATSVNQQPQQLAGQNPMLAQMLAQTPKTLSVPTIITTEIVSQVPQDRLPKNLEKKLIHTPATTNSQFSTPINQYENFSQNVTCNINTSVGNVSSLSTISSSSIGQSNQQKSQIQTQSQFSVNNSRLQQRKHIQVIPRKFLNSNDQQLQNNLMNSNHQSSQQHSIQISGNQKPLNKIITSNNNLNLNDNKGQSVTEIAQSQNVSVVLNNSNTFLMINQMSMSNNTGSSDFSLQIPTSNSTPNNSFYSENTTSSINNMSTINNGSTYTSAPSSSTNVTLSSLISNSNSCMPSSSIDSNDLNQLNNVRNSISNTPLISSTVVESPNSASNSEDTLLLKILDEFANPDSPAHGTSSPILISSTTLQQFRATPTSNNSMPNLPCSLNEKLAISEIQKQLMSFDTNNIRTNNDTLSQTQPLLNNNSNNQTMSSNNNVTVTPNSFGPPPAYQTATQQTQNINLIQSTNNNQMLCGMQRPILISSQQANCNETQRMTTQIQNIVNGNNRVMSPRMNLVSSNNNMNTTFMQQTASSNNMINNIASNSNSSVLNPIVSSSPQMMQISSNNPTSTSINQRIPKTLVDRKQKMQFTQQINNKRFISQLSPLRQSSQTNAGQQDGDICINNLHQNQYDSIQQTNNSPQSQQAQAIMMNSNNSSLFPVQHPKVANSNLNNTNTGVASTSFTSSYLNSSSQPPQSPHLQIPHKNISSPHLFSPSSPASTTIHHHNQQNIQQSQHQMPYASASSISSQQKIQTNPTLPVNNSCWSVPLHTNSPIGLTTNNGNSKNLINVTSSILSNRIQQNPMLNAQLSHGSISYLQTHNTSNSQQQSNSLLNQTTLSPSTSSSSSLNSGNVSMHFSRNSPILSSGNNQQYSSSLSFHNISNPTTSPMQVQTNSIQRVPQSNAIQTRPINASRLTMNDNNIVNNSQSFYQTENNVVNRNINIQPQQNQQQQSAQYSQQYGNCIMTNNINTNNNNASSEYVRQKVRAKIDSRNPQQQNMINSVPVQIQSRPQFLTLQAQQPIQQQNLTQIQQQQQNVQQHISVQHQPNNQHQSLLNQTYTTQTISSQQQHQQSVSMNLQLNSSLTAEDFDAMCVGLELSDQIAETSQSSLFNFDDLSESNTIDTLDLGNSLSIINNNSNENNNSVVDNGNIRNQSLSNNGNLNTTNNNTNIFQQQPLQSQQQNRNKQKGSLLQQLLSEPT